MWALVKNNAVVLATSAPRRIVKEAGAQNDVQYPLNILRLWSVDELKAVGIYSVIAGKKPDPTFQKIKSHSIDYDAGTDTVAENIVAEDKPAKDIYPAIKEKLHSMRQERLHGGFEYTVGAKTLVIETDQWGQQALTGALAAASADVLPVGFVWRTRDNTEIALDVAKAKLLAKAAMDYSYGVWKAAWLHKRDLKGYTTVAEIQAHDWDQYWPPMAPPE